MTTEPRPTASSITDPQLTAILDDRDWARQLLSDEQAAHTATVNREETAEEQRDSARRWATALENENAELRAAVDRVRAEHAPVPSGDETVCAVCCGGTYDCEDVPWPCTTIEALNGPPEAVAGPHSAPQAPGGPEGHPTVERAAQARTGARIGSPGHGFPLPGIQSAIDAATALRPLYSLAPACPTGRHTTHPGIDCDQADADAAELQRAATAFGRAIDTAYPADPR